MKRILITGGTGFFGKSILDYNRRHPLGELTILSRSAARFAANNPELSDGVRFIAGDVRTFSVGDAKYDWVIHAATPARTDVPNDEMRSIILDGTANVLRQAKACGAEKFMMVSSGGVYGRGFARPISEEDAPRPVTAYGIAKLEAEQMAADSGLFALLPRCFAFVGKHLDREAHFAIGNFIRDALRGEDLVIKGDGTSVRSYLYADDLVEWLWAILERGVSGRVYNVGSDESVSIRELAGRVCESLGAKGAVRVLGQPVPGAANVYVPDVRRAKAELGLRVKVGLAEAIRKFADLI